MPQTQTRIAFLLDATASMASIKDVTISAFNEYLFELQKISNATFSLVLFNSLRTVLRYENVPVSQVQGLDIDNYHPAGNTPLIDATVKLIQTTVEAVQAGDKIVIIIQTDGAENCSTQHTLAELAALIKAKTEAGWEFVFLGAGIDAYSQAHQFGIDDRKAMSYGKGERHTRAAFRGLGQTMACYALGDAASMDFTDALRDEAGDAFRPSAPAPKPGHLIGDIEI
jgi:hypothetical protein